MPSFTGIITKNITLCGCTSPLAAAGYLNVRLHCTGVQLRCWASCLNDCAKGPSREHYVSDGIFDSELITAFGLEWCREKPATIGLKGAVAKILCGKHNSALSEFDNEAATFSRFLAKNVLAQPLAESTIALRGRHLEKWALKTFFNLGYVCGLHREQPNSLEPPEELVRYIFLDSSVADGVGLYFVTGKVVNDQYQEGLSWNAIQHPQRRDEVFGMAFTFCGVRFVVSIPPMRAEKNIASLGEVSGFDYSSAGIFYRPSNIVLSSSTAGQKRIDFEW